MFFFRDLFDGVLYLEFMWRFLELTVLIGINDTMSFFVDGGDSSMWNGVLWV